MILEPKEECSRIHGRKRYKKNGMEHPRRQIQKGFIDPSNTCICCQLARSKRVKKKINKR
jgi:hypothetical protein